MLPHDKRHSKLRFLLFLWFVTIIVLFLGSIAIYAVEPGYQPCGVCGYTQLSKYTTVPPVSEDETCDGHESLYRFSDFFTSKSKRKEKWKFIDAFFFTYGMISTTGSDYVPTTHLGMVVTGVLVAFGIPVVILLMGGIEHFVRQLVETITEIIKLSCPSFFVEPKPAQPCPSFFVEPKPAQPCPSFFVEPKPAQRLRGCLCQPGICRQPQLKRVEIQEIQPRFCTPEGLRKPRIPGGSEGGPGTPETERKDEDKGKDLNIKIIISAVLCFLFALLTVNTVRPLKKSCGESMFISMLWFTTLEFLEIRMSSFAFNMLLICWDMIGISIFSVFIGYMTEKVEIVLGRLYVYVAGFFSCPAPSVDARPKHYCYSCRQSSSQCMEPHEQGDY